jgi:hypothetical protein
VAAASLRAGPGHGAALSGQHACRTLESGASSLGYEHLFALEVRCARDGGRPGPDAVWRRPGGGLPRSAPGPAPRGGPADSQRRAADASPDAPARPAVRAADRVPPRCGGGRADVQPAEPAHSDGHGSVVGHGRADRRRGRASGRLAHAHRGQGRRHRHRLCRQAGGRRDGGAHPRARPGPSAGRRHRCPGPGHLPRVARVCPAADRGCGRGGAERADPAPGRPGHPERRDAPGHPLDPPRPADDPGTGTRPGERP